MSDTDGEDTRYLKSSEEVFDKIRNILDGKKLNYRVISHEKTYTSEESAKARNEELKIGGKSMILRNEYEFVLVVISASRKLDSRKFRKFMKSQKLRFATFEELRELTGLLPGCIPPFGFPILPYRIYIDKSITENINIAFNAGSLTKSIVMGVEDYLEVAQGTIVDCTMFST